MRTQSSWSCAIERRTNSRGSCAQTVAKERSASRVFRCGLMLHDNVAERLDGFRAQAIKSGGRGPERIPGIDDWRATICRGPPASRRGNSPRPRLFYGGPSQSFVGVPTSGIWLPACPINGEGGFRDLLYV